MLLHNLSTYLVLLALVFPWFYLRPHRHCALAQGPIKPFTSLFSALTPNRQAHLSIYGVPMAILARDNGFGPKTYLAFSSSPKRHMAFG